MTLIIGFQVDAQSGGALSQSQEGIMYLFYIGDRLQAASLFKLSGRVFMGSS